MRRLTRLGIAALLAAAFAESAPAQELNFRAVAPQRSPSPEPIVVTLGRPRLDQEVSLSPPAYAQRPTSNYRVARGQNPGDVPPIPVPPPPPFPGPGGAPTGAPRPPVFPGFGGGGPQPPIGGRVRPNDEDYNCGRINSDADQGNIFERFCDKMRRCWYDVSDGIRGGIGGLGAASTRGMFQSDTEHRAFISPVTNPHFFEDPRALTELRPIFTWQRTPNSNPVFAGGNNFHATLQARAALTEHVSLVVNRLGWVWADVANPTQGLADGNGFSEVHLGPKFTFLGIGNPSTVGALGVNFELPVGSAKVGQSTGNWSISPYFSFAQNFWRSDYGSFNFMNTTGYSLGIDSRRTDFVYASFHLDYDVGNAQKFYPLVEVNWAYYTFNGSARTLGFEGNNLFNFGSNGVAGRSDLTVALGARYRVSDHLQFGLAGEYNVLGGGAKRLDLFRVTFDIIFRY